MRPTTGAPATTTTLEVAPNPGFQDIPEILIAHVSPLTAAGTVQFTDSTTNTDLGSVPVIAGQAVLVTTALTAGTHTVTATFTPTSPAAFAPSTSSPVTVTVTRLF